MSAYNELYLNDAMNNLGDMIDYAVCCLGYDPDDFFAWFISSGIAAKYERGNPKYISGMSGYETADAVLCATNIEHNITNQFYISSKGKEYWAGWILAYYQWLSGLRFEDLAQNGLSVSDVLSMYVLHEADISKFASVADEIIARNKDLKDSKLHQIRKARGFTQQQLSRVSGVALRMIQLYEQKQNDINKASVGTVNKLAKVLGCNIEDLID